MAGSVFGKIFRISTWGESHGKGIGVVIDGCPAGLRLCEEDIQPYLDRRKPGRNEFATPRSESDTAEILSGVFEGVTTGTPISIAIMNKTQRSGDYSEIAQVYRPGHADYTFDQKYGIRDYRGGGRSSGRETAARVAAGAVAAKLLGEMGIAVNAYTLSIGDIRADVQNGDIALALSDPLCMPDSGASRRAQEYLRGLREKGDSAGGVVECVIKGIPAGLGETVFDKYDARLAQAVMSIGAVKGVEIGAGFEAARKCGTEDNDPFLISADGTVTKGSNNSGGILGGMSDGISPVVLRAAFKATPSVSAAQRTVDKDGAEREIRIKGRHDPVIVPRAVVVVEAMAALVTADLLLENMAARLDGIKRFYTR